MVGASLMSLMKTVTSSVADPPMLSLTVTVRVISVAGAVSKSKSAETVKIFPVEEISNIPSVPTGLEESTEYV